MTSATTSNNKRQRRSREAWREVLTRFAASGLEVEAFCAHEGLSVSSFRRWRSLLADDVSRGVELPAPGAQQTGFVDAGLLGAGGRLELRLDLGAGVILHLSRG